MAGVRDVTISREALEDFLKLAEGERVVYCRWNIAEGSLFLNVKTQLTVEAILVELNRAGVPITKDDLLTAVNAYQTTKEKTK